MGKIERIVADLREEILADIEHAVSAGEFGSVGEAVAQMATDWAMGRHTDAPEFQAHALAMIEESRRDPHPGHPMEQVFAELRARYADPADAVE